MAKLQVHSYRYALEFGHFPLDSLVLMNINWVGGRAQSSRSVYNGG